MLEQVTEYTKACIWLRNFKVFQVKSNRFLQRMNIQRGIFIIETDAKKIGLAQNFTIIKNPQFLANPYETKLI